MSDSENEDDLSDLELTAEELAEAELALQKKLEKKSNSEKESTDVVIDLNSDTPDNKNVKRRNHNTKLI